ncbi:hypothetical protein BD626DRAFT_479156 [Schizophyllum amplum]|uniref:Uncharacterized protein n=1 Tax=Schizophyllum amplum TaxID=97359 RepID=A0A550CRY7_9AGAR|nr:hypothetical protein BD626DRAFT_479156 [Auriculariopsis ampla]
MAVPFSRLQLAAALLEYDNDPNDPDAPARSAQESAIFAHYRRNPRPQQIRRPSDYLGVELPSDAGGGAAPQDSKAAELRQSIADYRRSRGTSLDMLRNPFAQEDVLEEGSMHEPEKDEHEMEVDLSSWGLDALMPKDKKGKGRAKPDKLPLPVQKSVQPLLSPQAQQVFPHDALPTIPRRTERSQSAGNYDELLGSGDDRRRTIAAALDYEQIMPMRRRAVSNPLEPSTSTSAAPEPESGLAYLDDEPADQPQRIPFPAQSVRAPSPMLGDRASGYFGQRPAHERAYSSGSANVLADAERRRVSSNATQKLLDEDNPFAIHPPSRASRFDPKAAAHARTMSNASLGSRMMLADVDAQSVRTNGNFERERSRPLSTMDLLRPKVLVMPSPLQSASLAPPAQPVTRDGFIISADGTPLPPGARASRRASALNMLGIEPSAVPIASNSFTPNPRINLTLSQLTFRNNLPVDGQRDVAYTDIEANLARATEDGEQIQLLQEPTMEAEVAQQAAASSATLPGRSAGKLFGVSLIDHLEQRKAEMRSKQRVFKGDDRPTMMARGQLQRQTTFIDPATLNLRPQTQRMSSYQSAPDIMRRNSQGKPLIDMAAEGLTPPRALGQPSAVRSVFGVDTLWERETAKLRELEAQEKLEEEERLRKEAEEEARNPKKKKKGKKGKKDQAGESSLSVNEISPSASSVAATPAAATPDVPRISAEPPTLPAIPKATARRPPPPTDDDDSSDSDDSEDERPVAARPNGQRSDSQKWFAGASDDEDDGPRRTTGTGPRNPRKAASQPPPGDDSEEDLPLAATLNRAMARQTIAQAADDSDEDKPLAAVIDKAKLSLPPINFDGLLSKKDAGGDDDEDEDNEPLGLRASRAFPPASGHGEDEDDLPLGMHPDQQRRTQFLAAQQQNLVAQQMMFQQQQQMMMNPMASMYFNPSMVGSGFFAPPMGTGMMPMAPVQAPPSPPPVQDPMKFGRVDRWRRDVAVEGEP